MAADFAPARPSNRNMFIRSNRTEPSRAPCLLDPRLRGDDRVWGGRRSSSQKQRRKRIRPIRVVLLYQPDLPSPTPFLELLFARDRRAYIHEVLVMDEPVNRVFPGEGSADTVAVFADPPRKVIRDARYRASRPRCLQRYRRKSCDPSPWANKPMRLYDTFNGEPTPGVHFAVMALRRPQAVIPARDQPATRRDTDRLIVEERLGTSSLRGCGISRRRVLSNRNMLIRSNAHTSPPTAPMLTGSPRLRGDDRAWGKRRCGHGSMCSIGVCGGIRYRKKTSRDAGCISLDRRIKRPAATIWIAAMLTLRKHKSICRLNAAFLVTNR